MMISRRAMFCKLAIAGALALRVSAWAANSPLEVIRSAVNQVVTILQNPAHQGEAQRQERINKVWEVAVPYFDVQELAQRALGVHWQKRTEEERREFVRLFTALVENTYSSVLARYSSDVQFFFDQERVEGNFAEVDTRLFNPALDKTVPIRYQLHRVGEQWLIYDVVIEHVSMVRNYRTQFDRILRQSSYEDLIQSIKSKVQELSTGSSASAS